jgi:hypothetical protein
VFGIELTGDVLTAAAAVIGAAGGMMAGWAAILRARREKDDECLDKLNNTRRELGELFDKWEMEREKRLEVESKFPGHDLAGWGGGSQ